MMVEDRIIQHDKLPEDLAELKRAAIAELERRGYDVRGKTPTQIRRLLKGRPSTLKSIVSGKLAPDA
jgi:hypothetical protein